MLDACLNSILLSTFLDFEVIVVDDNSKDNTKEILEKYKSRIRYISNNFSEYLINSRNKGASIARGDYLVFIDDDNIVDKKMIYELVNAVKNNIDIAMAGPLMLYSSEPEIIWWSRTVISKNTGRTYFPLRNKNILEIKEEVRDTDGIPNVFLVKKTFFDEIGGFDNTYINTWTEGDFGARAQQRGLRLIRVTAAKTYHQVLPSEFQKVTARSIGDSPIKAYTTIRNRYKWIGKYGTPTQKIIFIIFWSWLILLFYIYKAFTVGTYKFIPQYIKGAKDGLPLIFETL
jgi:GT2 family glycosyltransferase